MQVPLAVRQRILLKALAQTACSAGLEALEAGEKLDLRQGLLQVQVSRKFVIVQQECQPTACAGMETLGCCKQ